MSDWSEMPDLIAGLRERKGSNPTSGSVCFFVNSSNFLFVRRVLSDIGLLLCIVQKQSSLGLGVSEWPRGLRRQI